VLALAGLNADAVGLMEIQNNGTFAAQNLVDALNAQVGAGTYAVVPDPIGGTGSDAIRVAMIYKPSRLSLVGSARSDAASVNSRPPMAQTFAAANGEKVTLVVNHLKSKGSCPSGNDHGNSDSGDGQGCWNALRVQQAQQLRTFVAQMQSLSGSNDVLLVGDFNAYAQEDPIYDLTSAGYVDQIGRFYPTLGYSYVFDGQAGRLDHAITTSSLSSKVTRAVHWHINADESLAQDYNFEFKAPNTNCGGLCPPDPYDGSVPARSSDHDPVLLGLNLVKSLYGTVGRDILVGTAGDDYIVGGAGADLLSGGAGANIFAYGSMRDAGDTVLDFVPGKDRIDLRSLLAGLGFGGGDAVASGWVRFVAVPNGTSVQIDIDGPANGAAFRQLLTLQGVSPASLQSARDLIVQ
jgi:Ca2+-binding RTX toxin-like protein